MNNTFHIIIPAITFDHNLKDCLESINKIKKVKFFVTVVLDYDFNKKIKLSFLKYRCNFMVTGKINMSKKRNLAVQKYKSKYIIFFDSDIKIHKNWLSLALKILNKYNCDIVGGPSILEKKSKFLNKITYLSKASYFTTGYQNFRKNKSKPRFCDWLESCNIMMFRNFYLKFNGMNEKLYTGEDKEFQERIRKVKKDLKIFYHPSLYVFHKERKYFGFLLQRMTFGMDVLNLIKFNYGFKGFQPLLPSLGTFVVFYFLLIKDYDYLSKLFYVIFIFLIFFFYILIEQKKNKNTLKESLLVAFTIILANISFGIGSFLGLINLKKILSKFVYRMSRII